MAIFLRGNVWWFEWRTRKERVVKSTGFHKADKAKAQAVFDAFRLARGQKPRRTVVEGILEAIYQQGKHTDGELVLPSVWSVYQDWMTGKGKVVSHKELVERRGIVDRFVKWAVDSRSCRTLADVDVSVAREYVARLRTDGLANKTQRRVATVLSAVWEAVGQLQAGIHNPWRAATPDKDGTEVARGAFSAPQEERVLNEAQKVGHDWRLASVISRWTGLRYGDVARLQWEQIDMDERTIDVTPGKTRRHGVRLKLPIAGPLFDELSKIKEREGFVLPEHALCYPHPFLPPFSLALKAAGLDLKRYTFHSWRHTFRTRLGEAGADAETARRLGGWTNLKMSSHYDHATHLAEMRDAIAKMEGAAGS